MIISESEGPPPVHVRPHLAVMLRTLLLVCLVSVSAAGETSSAGDCASGARGLEERSLDAEVVIAAYTRTVHPRNSSLYSAEFLVFNVIKGEEKVSEVYSRRQPSSLETALNRRLVNVSGLGDPSRCEADVTPGETYILLLDVTAGELTARYDGAYGPAVLYSRDKELALEAIGSWGEWSPCSGSCGGGIQQRRRECSESKCSDDEGQQRTCNMFPCSSILNVLESAGVHRSPLHPSGRPYAYKLLPNGHWRSREEEIVFPRTFPWEFSLLATVRLKSSSSGGFLLRVLHSGSLQVGLYLSDIITLVLSDKKDIRVSFIKSLFDGHWHQLALSVRRDTVSFFMDCEFSGKLPLPGKVRPFGGQPATLVVGSTGDHELDAFQGDIEQLTITGSPDAAEKQCNSTTQPINFRGGAYALRQEVRSRPVSSSTQNDWRGGDFTFDDPSDDEYDDYDDEKTPDKDDANRENKIPLKEEPSDGDSDEDEEEDDSDEDERDDEDDRKEEEDEDEDDEDDPKDNDEDERDDEDEPIRDKADQKDDDEDERDDKDAPIHDEGDLKDNGEDDRGDEDDPNDNEEDERDDADDHKDDEDADEQKDEEDINETSEQVDVVTDKPKENNDTADDTETKDIIDIIDNLDISDNTHLNDSYDDTTKEQGLSQTDYEVTQEDLKDLSTAESTSSYEDSYEHVDEEIDDEEEEGSGDGSEIKLAWSEWSPCSATCNWGRRTRTSYCLDNGANLESCAEASAKRSDTEACFLRLCPALTTTTLETTTLPANISAALGPKPCQVRCLNGGTCLPPYKCSCPPGVYGSLCQYAKQACRVNCRNGGTCLYGSTCVCHKGYFGSECQYAACKPHCWNGGYCVAPNKCRCKPGYIGNFCQKAVCQNGCKNGGECVASNKCACRSGFTGKDCSQPFCNPPCQNGGDCVKPYFCHCPKSTRGAFCEKHVCNPDCQNGGICLGKGKCSCPRGFSGVHCEQAYCPGGCLNGGQCGKTAGKCSCPTGFSGSRCEKKKPCKFVEIKEPYKRGYKQKVTTQAKVPCGAWSWKLCTKTKVHYEMVYKTFYKTSYECEEELQKNYYEKLKSG